MSEQTSWVEEKTVKNLQEALESGELTSRKLVLTYLKRISELDSTGPNLNSIIEVNPDALYLADKLDTERKEGKVRGALHGLPVVIKDNIDTNDKMHTSAGSLLLKNHVAKEDAFIVKQLRKAGAILLGKANLTEWANFIAEDMPTGYSSRGGQTLNPYGKDFMVGGSSAGTGAAITSNLAVVGIGTETSGSILSPASQNSLVGVKPTVGLISRSGIIPISHTQDTAGPMTRTVEDAAILLSVIQGKDENDPVTGIGPSTKIDYTNHLKKGGLKGKRIGIARKPYFDYVEKEKQQLMDEAIEQLKAQGAEIVENIEVPSAGVDWDINVMLYEFKPALEAYLKTVDSSFGLRTLNDLINGNRNLGSKALKYGQALFYQAAATSGQLTESAYLNSLIFDQEQSREKGIDAALEKNQLDAIVTPNNAGAMIPAKAGYPSITVPAGYTTEGEPVGLTFTASAYAEPTLFECAYGYEQATNCRKAPQF
ncbi:amidase [Marinilactibacillus sp. GCM10026970]|uniref:amidase n=1 Tax=Marinilactibacillus sp. GCM10026970 TaxID=3252642 RepID=UPI00360E8B50